MPITARRYAAPPEVPVPPMPLRFDDLMAARMVAHQAPDKRHDVGAFLDALREGKSQKSLLTSLVEGEVLTMDQARFVHGMVERWKRGRGVAVYAHLLAREGIPPERVKRFVDQVGEGDVNVLGESVLATGQVTPDREQQIRFQARMAVDRDQAQQLQSFLDGQGRASAQTQTAPGAPSPTAPPPTGDGLGGSALLRSTDVNVPASAEDASRIVRGTLSDADDELPGPQFRIPEWIDMSDPRTGKSIQGYRVLGRIGAGAMGVVYLCDHQTDPKRPIALKLLPKDADSDQRGRFKREVLANGFFSHANAIEIVDAGETDQGHHYMAMEFFEGKDLSVVLDAEKRLAPRRALALARQCFEALDACHSAGVVHRDVKPANILVSRDGEQAKIMDFGIAIVRDLGEFETKVFRSMEGGVTGTPEFMSPEQAGGDALSESTDLYSMGVVMYQMLSGRLPFESETSQGFVSCHLLENPLPLAKAHADTKGLPKELLELVDGLLEKTPKKRPPSAKAVVELIDALLPKVKEKKGTQGFWGMLWGRS
jgi:hypothetical protein